jgi:hypothetical protein
MVFTDEDRAAIKFLRENKQYGAKRFLSEFPTKHRIMNVNELRERILNVWDEFDQRVIDNAVRQWRARLRACVKAKGGHFEHKLK